MSDEWFAFQLAPDGDVEDGCHPEEAQALKDYLRHKTTAAEAARAITHPIVTSNNPEEDLDRLWAFLMRALVELPKHHIEPLLVLLKAIEELPSPDFTAVDEDSRPVEKLWKELPGFGHMWFDAYQSGCWRTTATESKGPERETLRNEHVRIAEIEARLVKAGVAGIPIDWGYETVADGLESSNALLDFEVPVAAEWLVRCGQRFREGARKGEQSWGLRTGVANRNSDRAFHELWKATTDTDVMSLERLAFWECRLEELQTEPGVAGDAAKRALAAMRNEE
jgi:hypothetical protein